MSNLITLAGENAPISLGLHIGLNHVYGGNAVPPCIRGTLGSAVWSTAAGNKVTGSIQTAEQFQAGENEPAGAEFSAHSDESITAPRHRHHREMHAAATHNAVSAHE